MRLFKIDELKQNDFLGIGTVVADVLEAAGITDDDLPDIVPDDLDYEDREVMERNFPVLVAKLTEAWGDA